MASGPITSWQIERARESGRNDILFFWTPK